MEDWLQSIGLGRYISAFQEHGITADQLASLTDSDLRELGLSIGDRKRFLAAIAAEPPPPPTAPIERRPLTVMFIDLAGSSALAERLDPEDLLKIIGRYRERCVAAITRFGGKVARFVGDGILAYFCYPIANENDPERAARAAMEIARGMAGDTTPDGEPLQVRIALATGIVIVGDLIAGTEVESLGVLGSTPNLAARLQALAPPNGTVVAEQTYGRIRRRFECERMTPVQLSGFSHTEQPWLILHERMSRGSGARRLGGNELTPLVGREAELDALRTLWRQAAQGEGRIALITGEGGIGKSRLLTHFLNETLPSEATLVEINASAFDTDSPLRPFIDLIQSEAELTGADDRDQALHRLRSSLVRDARQHDEATAILAGLLGLPYHEPAIAALPPEQLRERTITLLAEQIAARGRGGPLCVVVEDLHWLDPSSCEVLAALLRMIADRPCLLLITGRDGAALTWLSHHATTTLQLGRLDALHTTRMVRSLLGTRSLTARLVKQIADRTDGVPLFIEEVARTIVERTPDTLPEAPLPGEADRNIPASLHESLMARLDRAGGARHIAQVASVAGRTVRRDILAAACGTTSDELDRALATLVASGILEQDLRAGGNSYAFSHSLLRDAAYDSLLRDRRRELHEKVGAALQELMPELLAQQPEMLATHLTSAGKTIEAAPLWLEAARNSLSRSALTEAARLLRRGLSALAELSPNNETLRLRLQLSAPLGAALMGLHGPFAAETQDHYAGAYELCRSLPEEEAHFPIYWGWWRVAPDYRAHLDRAASLLERANARQDPALLLQAHHCSWAINFHVGALERCCEHMRAGLAIYEVGDYAHHAHLYGNHDAKVCAHGGLCQLYWMQGRLQSAVREEAASLEWAECTNHLGSRVHALGLTLLYRVYCCDEDAVLARADELLALTGEYGLKEHEAAATIFRGWVLSRRGEPQGLAMIEHGFARQREVASTEDFPVYLCLLAEALIAHGRAAEAVERMTAERAAFDDIGLRLWIPELLRVTADTLLIATPGALDAAKALLVEADEIAIAQGVHMLRLRLARSGLKLAQRRGSTHVAEAAQRFRDRLAEIPEPDDSPELREAEHMSLSLASAS